MPPLYLPFAGVRGSMVDLDEEFDRKLAEIVREEDDWVEVSDRSIPSCLGDEAPAETRTCTPNRRFPER